MLEYDKALIEIRDKEKRITRLLRTIQNMKTDYGLLCDDYRELVRDKGRLNEKVKKHRGSINELVYSLSYITNVMGASSYYNKESLSVKGEYLNALALIVKYKERER